MRAKQVASGISTRKVRDRLARISKSMARNDFASIYVLLLYYDESVQLFYDE